MKDLFLEIWENVRRNKLRTALTGFAVAWGIFMIILLLGAGNGVMNAMTEANSGIDINTMTVYGGVTTSAFGGLREGRQIELDIKDLDVLRSEAFADVIDEICPEISISSTLVYRGEDVSCDILACTEILQQMNCLELLEGRFINENDLRQRRKVVVIEQQSAELLCGSAAKARSILGKQLKLGDVSFKVIGIIKSDASSGWRMAYVPFDTAVSVFSRGTKLDRIEFRFHGLATEAENEAFEARLRSAINLKHSAAPDDASATWIENRFVQSMQMDKGMGLIRKGLWIIGILTLVSGIVGVGNIMLITARERRLEFGIRKAIGARPWDILKLMLSESVVITAIFGYVGMFLGFVACDIMDRTVGSRTTVVLGEEITMMSDPGVGLDVALQATLLLVVAGALAGLIPAWKAAKVKPVEALKAE
ncbi:MAG: ABC transporter permease [Candidatus Cryptobacteroides sp.]|nr:ABC transporter permease [Rikenellaceae bacterium]MDY5745946.1 ABC transporter permease [Candidatus Cryptobacteroides sp.]